MDKIIPTNQNAKRYPRRTSPVPGVQTRHARNSNIIKLFADNSLLYRTISNQEESDIFPKDLTSLGSGKINGKWTKCIVIRKQHKNRPVIPTNYKSHGHTLDTIEAGKYLGVTISDTRVNLRFKLFN